MARGGAGGPSGRSACQGDTLGIASSPLAVPWVPLGSDFRGSKMRRFRPQPRQPTVSGEEGLSPGGAVALSAGLGELGELAQGPPSSPAQTQSPLPRASPTPQQGGGRRGARSAPTLPARDPAGRPARGGRWDRARAKGPRAASGTRATACHRREARTVGTAGVRESRSGGFSFQQIRLCDLSTPLQRLKFHCCFTLCIK